MKFSIKSRYLPVKKEIYENDRLLEFVEEYQMQQLYSHL